MPSSTPQRLSRVRHGARAQEAPELAALAKANDRERAHARRRRRSRSVAALARELAAQPLDILLNNAGVMGPKQQNLGKIDYAGMLETLNVNSIAPLRLAEAFLEQRRQERAQADRRDHQRHGQHRRQRRRPYAYRASKAALNMSYHNLALDLKEPRHHRSRDQSRLGADRHGRAGAPVTPSASIAAMRKVFDGLTLADSGKFLDYKGGTWEW